MRVRRDEATGQFELSEAGKPVLRYNYQTNDPGEVLARVKADDRKYARARSDYIHPLYGLDGQELTKDWPLEHPHHRGIYWAWPEVDYRGERGDLHALRIQPAYGQLHVQGRPSLRAHQRRKRLAVGRPGTDCARAHPDPRLARRAYRTVY
jgi:hypothetical protein